MTALICVILFCIVLILAVLALYIYSWYISVKLGPVITLAIVILFLSSDTDDNGYY